MATVAWSQFLPDVLPEVPGVSDPLAERHVREAAIEFCVLSRAYVHYMDPVDLTALEGVYDWEVPEKTLVVEPLDVWLGGKRLTPKTPAELAALYGDWTIKQGEALYYLSDRADGSARQVTLVPTPEAVVTGGLTARLALKPTRDAETIDELIYEDYGKTIAMGAVASLLLMVNKPWSNALIGTAFKQRFEIAAAQAALGADKGHVRAPLRVKTHFGLR